MALDDLTDYAAIALRVPDLDDFFETLRTQEGPYPVAGYDDLQIAWQKMTYQGRPVYDALADLKAMTGRPECQSAASACSYSDLYFHYTPFSAVGPLVSYRESLGYNSETAPYSVDQEILRAFDLDGFQPARLENYFAEADLLARLKTVLAEQFEVDAARLEVIATLADLDATLAAEFSACELPWQPGSRNNFTIRDYDAARDVATILLGLSPRGRKDCPGDMVYLEFEAAPLDGFRASLAAAAAQQKGFFVAQELIEEVGD